MSKMDSEEYIPQMVTIKEASHRTGFSYDFLRKECLKGNLVYIRVGNGKFLINLDLLIDQMKTAHGSLRNNERQDNDNEY